LRLLLHACCGPCSLYSTGQLLAEGVEPTLFFVNPNIHPYREYEARYESLRRLTAERGWPLLVEPVYDPAAFFNLINQHEQDRCRYCYQLRLAKTAARARELGFGHYSTTLLISPYQNRDLLLEIGRRVGREHGLVFYEADWRPGFQKSQAEAKMLGLYRQQYCGCLYSEMGRYYRPTAPEKPPKPEVPRP